MKFKKPTSKDLTEKAYDIRCRPPPGQPLSNVEHIPISGVPLYDLRPVVNTLSLDVQGFAVAEINSRMSYEDFFDERKLQSVFAEDVRSYLTETLGASCVYFHECVIRKRSKKGDSQNGYGQPATKAHGDYTLREVCKILGELGGEAVAQELTTRRYQALNIWKPLKGPVKDWPLALCDLRTLDPKDMVPMDEVYPEDVLESYQVHYRDTQKWYYLKDQTASEYLIFKSADSVVEGAVPHCSFRDPDTPMDEPGRESVELRALVIY